MDGETEVGGQLQPPPGPDGEARGVVCELAEDRPADGFPERVLRSSQTSGTVEITNAHAPATGVVTTHFLLLVSTISFEMVVMR